MIVFDNPTWPEVIDDAIALIVPLVFVLILIWLFNKD
jgi:hypothetical protein